eukprot:TRINITY_DN9996_c0_g1_i1.p1 TRINITY_DN9996_c0_g1~~TRINITY_DN9996_c0_g1_i1.p1  ORF type:complete len:107 (+),score=17.75 TRINITY_DN9996_c0_g1_i1:78-398(+)
MVSSSGGHHHHHDIGNQNGKKKKPERTREKSNRDGVDLSKLDIGALKRYKRTYKLRLRHNSSRAELLTAINKHFSGLAVNEAEILEVFLETLNSGSAEDGPYVHSS